MTRATCSRSSFMSPSSPSWPDLGVTYQEPRELCAVEDAAIERRDVEIEMHGCPVAGVAARAVATGRRVRTGGFFMDANRQITRIENCHCREWPRFFREAEDAAIELHTGLYVGNVDARMYGNAVHHIGLSYLLAPFTISRDCGSAKPLGDCLRPLRNSTNKLLTGVRPGRLYFIDLPNPPHSRINGRELRIYVRPRQHYW
jgi:hypothetical protein